MKTWKKLLVILISAAITFFAETAVNIACGPEPDPYDYFISFFHNNVAGEKDYNNFYFTEYRYLFNEEEPADEDEMNSREWTKEIGGSVKAIDVQKLMYGLDPATDSLLVQQLLSPETRTADTLSSNTFLQFLLNGKKKNYREYFLFAKEVEFSNPNFDPWSPVQADTLKLRNLQKRSLQMAKSEKNRFLKSRYYYQAAKLSRYAGDFEQVIQIHDDHLRRQTAGSRLSGWALALKAGALYHLGDSVESAYLFSKIFDAYPERRVQAYRNYRNAISDSSMVLKLARNNEERAVIFAIEGFGNPSLNLTYLDNCYRLFPASKMNGVLLAREINKLESTYLTDRLKKEDFYNEYQFMRWYYDASESNARQQEQHLEALKRFSLKLATDRKYPQPELGYIAASYLCWMQNRTEEGLSYLRQIKGSLQGKTFAQEKIVQLLLATQKIKNFNRVNEQELLPVLTWLDEMSAQESLADTAQHRYYAFSSLSRFTSTTRNFYQLILAPAYMAKGDTLSAALAMLKGDQLLPGKEDQDLGSWQTSNFFHRYLKSSTMLALLQLRQDPPDAPYLNFLSKPLRNLKPDILQELTATAFLREHQFAQALRHLRGISEQRQTKIIMGDWSEAVLDGNPFVDRLNDYPMRRDSINGFSKLKFAREMLALQDKLKKDPKNASRYYYRMANGYYNASAHGNSWYLISYSRVAEDLGRQPKYYYDQDFLQVRTAGEYYAKARSLSTDKEFKARCTFMLAKCRQKQIEIPQYSYGAAEDSYQKFLDAQQAYLQNNFSNPYFSQLQKDYGKTRFFTLAQTECSYFREFLKAK